MKNDFEEVALSAATMPSSPTHLSPYLRFGCLSPRMMWHRLTDCYGKVSIGGKTNKRNFCKNKIRLFVKVSFCGGAECERFTLHKTSQSKRIEENYLK